MDPAVGLRTADKVWEAWGDDQIRGWGRNILAINAARVGNPERAIYHLTNFGYWTFGDQGFAHRSGPSESRPIDPSPVPVGATVSNKFTYKVHLRLRTSPATAGFFWRSAIWQPAGKALRGMPLGFRKTAPGPLSMKD